MSIYILPCEIYQREFDAKLLLSCLLLQKDKDALILLGYDKYITSLCKYFPASTLLEKSCSSIMWNARIKPTIKNGGNVIINDEEGFNNIHEESRLAWFSRVNKQAASHISKYLCWGEVDFKFASEINELSSKLSIAGNSRSDLLGFLGKILYQEEISSYRTLYGDYVLCVDNFCCEHRQGEYLPPVFSTDKKVSQKLESEFLETQDDNFIRRTRYADLLEYSIKNSPERQFLIRPHPLSNPTWWHDRFYKYRNVHITNTGPIEAWLHACKCVVSMGCTVGFQALITRKPLIEIYSENIGKYKKMRGYAIDFTNLVAHSKEDLFKAIDSVYDSSFSISKTLNDGYEKLWLHNRFSFSTDLISDHLIEASSQIPLNAQHENRLKLKSILLKFNRYAIESNLELDQNKWITPTDDIITRKLSILKNILAASDVKLDTIAPGLYCLHNG